MSEPRLVLEYELTRERAKAEFRHFLKARRRSWWQGVAASVLMFYAVFWGLPNGDYWQAAICGVFGLELCFSLVSRVTVRALIRSSAFKSRKVRFELDDRGIVRGPRIPKQAPVRFWWKQLRRISEDEDSFNLNFGWQSLCVPQHAFADEEQRSTFRSLVAGHLFNRNRLARECAKLDHNEEQVLAEEAFTSDVIS